MVKTGYKLPVYNIQGQEVGQIDLDNSVFDGEINSSAVYQAVLFYRANQRKGLASTKTRGEVSGGGRKPWRQKGTGRARVGSTRSPLWRHGGVVFGPHPRDYSYTLPNKIKKLALKSSLNAKLKENNFIVLDQVILNSHKTKEMFQILKRLKINQKTLFLLDKIDQNILRSSRNINLLNTTLANQVNAYDVLAAQKLLTTRQAVLDLVKRLKQT